MRRRRDRSRVATITVPIGVSIDRNGSAVMLTGRFNLDWDSLRHKVC
jgi:hypothetical protein